MDSEGDAQSSAGMHVDSDADGYSDTCDYDEYNEGKDDFEMHLIYYSLV
jgi:hypothetical protein